MLALSASTKTATIVRYFAVSAFRVVSCGALWRKRYDSWNCRSSFMPSERWIDVRNGLLPHARAFTAPEPVSSYDLCAPCELVLLCVTSCT